MTGRSLRLVVADDDELLREMLSGLLGDLGYEVVAAVGDGAAAVQASLEHRPDLTLLDHRMPVLTGIEAARQLHDRLPALPTVILSAYDDVGLQRAARDAGATSYLVKGCTAAQIAEAIEAAYDSATRPAPPAPPAGGRPGTARPPGSRPSPFQRAGSAI
ncbi:ANTAR domain-containing response regulator [Jatrophihabitans endophyticus]|uniref:ANTAR domain-containing response regulator n=1 Tax=Jatrophihabitans endophyticus TaxID=1206085 RepID=UPI0019F53927|nr:response regulator [Jatrophihabitans endophyticus]MBE7187098.1 response regulator [Jatrophihabitans endophyticus]